MLSLNGSLSLSLDDIMALHTLNYRHTLLLLQPTERRKRVSRSQGKGEREVEREGSLSEREGDSEVRSVHIWSFMPAFYSYVCLCPASFVLGLVPLTV